MPLLLNLLLLLAFAGAAGGAIHMLRMQLETARRDSMQALAARRGWALTVTGERLGQAGTLRLAPRGGLPWVLEVRPKDGRRSDPVTEYAAEEPRYPGGGFILLTSLLDPFSLIDVQDGRADVAMFSNPNTKRVLRDLLGVDVARLALKLDLMAAPEGMLALSDGGPTSRLDLSGLNRALQGWAPVVPGPRGVPVLILTGDGMRLRLRHPIRRADQMERFLELAFDISRLIGP